MSRVCKSQRLGLAIWACRGFIPTNISDALLLLPVSESVWFLKTSKITVEQVSEVFVLGLLVFYTVKYSSITCRVLAYTDLLARQGRTERSLDLPRIGECMRIVQ